jgi:hypothetical protein
VSVGVERQCAGARKISRQSSYDEVRVNDSESREKFDSALSRIRHEIKSRLVVHGFFGTISYRDIESVDHVLEGSTIVVNAKGRAVERSFSRKEIEDCLQRISGAVLLGVISMLDEICAPPLVPR